LASARVLPRNVCNALSSMPWVIKVRALIGVCANAGADNAEPAHNIATTAAELNELASNFI
jgi:hypothetical protein